jgi:hypothetical protein
MKKSLLILTAAALVASQSLAQTVIFDNGPIADQPGIGVGGADASTLHDGMGTYGAGHAVSSGFRVADDLIVPVGETWVIDTLVFFAYQTGSGNTSTITEVNLNIWNGDPSDPGSVVVFSDGVTNLLIESNFVNAYRTGDFGSATCDPTTCNQRPIMRNSLEIGTTLTAGTYWLDWQTGGSGASGPWVPPVNLGAGITTTGNAKQFDPAALVWNDLFDGALLSDPQGLPYLAIGSVITGVEELNSNNSVSVFPNPMSESTTVTINETVAGASYSMKVYDILGNVVKSVESINEKTFVMERGSLSTGVYFYEVNRESTVIKNGKLIIQ